MEIQSGEEVEIRIGCPADAQVISILTCILLVSELIAAHRFAEFWFSKVTVPFVAGTFFILLFEHFRSRVIELSYRYQYHDTENLSGQVLIQFPTFS